MVMWYFVVLSSLFYQLGAYRPVYIIHGVLSNNISMAPMARRIQELHPGTKVIIASKYEGWSSLEPMWRQVEIYGSDFQQMSERHPEGFHLIGYSQGGLISRALLEKYPNHKVRTFISLSSPQAGQYGTKFLHLFFPQLALKTAYEVFYSVAGQLTSIGNYWNDPHHQDLYLQYSAFLPILNNEVTHLKNESYRKGLVSLKRLILIGGPDDDVITPYQSAFFGFYNENEQIVDMESRKIFTEDLIGLKILKKKGKMQRFVVDGVHHHLWRKNITVIDNFIIPFLD